MVKFALSPSRLDHSVIGWSCGWLQIMFNVNMMGNVDLTREVLLFCALSLGQRAHFLETHLKKKIGNSGFHK